MEQIDYVHFIVPKDKELQFPAMATLQEFVNTYVVRAKNNDTSRGKQTTVLEYTVDMPEEDWLFFVALGLTLQHLRYSHLARTHPDMIVDMSDDKLNAFKGGGKHATSVCNLLAGVQCPAIPKIKAVAPRMAGHRWLVVGQELEYLVGQDSTRFFMGTGEDLLRAQDNEWSGVIAHAGRVTYHAAAIGIGVVEILPQNRSVAWLSKWVNTAYRVVSAYTWGPEQLGQILRAVSSIERKAA